MSDHEDIAQEELDDQDAELLPERTAMSVIATPVNGGIVPDSGLDLVPPPTTE
jgi:hypothetical protein